MREHQGPARQRHHHRHGRDNTGAGRGEHPRQCRRHRRPCLRRRARPTAPWCWGLNDRGQLGDGTTVNKTTPVQAGASTLGSNVAEFDLGDGYDPINSLPGHTCAQDRRHPLVLGNNDKGQLGNGTITTTTTPVTTPRAGRGEHPRRQRGRRSLGAEHSCARTTDGTLWCWGDNAFRQLGRMGGELAVPYPGSVVRRRHLQRGRARHG